MKKARFHFLLILLLVSPSLVQAQTPRVLESPNGEEFGEFGAAVASVGDVNDDGASDVVVGAPDEDASDEINAGRAYIFSGADGSKLQTLTAPGESLGQSLATTQLEGTSYVIAGGDASSFTADNERAFLFNASDGSVVQTFKPSYARTVASAGDLNDDGTPDVLVSNPADSVDGAAGAGSASVLSGADGSTLLTLHSPNPGEDGRFGAALAGGRDVNGDGTPDIIVGAPREDKDDSEGTGRAYLIDGANGNVLQTLTSEYNEGIGAGTFGAAVATLSDINDDGTSDMIVGASTEDVVQTNPTHVYGVAGRVHLISGTDGTILHTLTAPPSTGLGRTVAAIGDVNADGASDVIAGAPGIVLSVNQGGPVHVFSGDNGSELDSLAQSPDENNAFGKAIAGAGDTNGNGIPDIIVGDRMANTDAGERAGRAYIYSGADLSLTARFSQSVSSNGTVNFGGTGVDITFSGVSGSGEVTVERFGTPPVSPDGISEENVSTYRFVIGAGDGLTFDEAAVRLDTGTLAGVSDASNVTVYSRPAQAEGSFTELPTRVESGDVVATANSFSEFVLASDSEPLPVEMAGFEGTTVEESRVRLTWQTTSETNNAGFEVQRRAGGQGSWTEVGFVESKAAGGTTSEAMSYQFEDADLPYAADKLAYRLRQVDVDGSESLSDRVTIQRTVDEVELLGTFPNPARAQATVQFAVPGQQKVALKLYDVMGREGRTLVRGPQEGRTEMQVELSGLSSGIYFLRLQAGGTTKTQKMTVVR